MLQFVEDERRVDEVLHIGPRRREAELADDERDVGR
jgi:hypothetical protein